MNQNYMTNRLIKEMVDKNQKDYVEPETEEETTNPETKPENTNENEVQTGDINLSVTDEENEGIQGVTVILFENDKETNYKCTTGAAGGCKIKSVPYGDYKAKASKEGYEDSEKTIKISTPSASLSISLERIGPYGTGATMIEEEGEF